MKNSLFLNLDDAGRDDLRAASDREVKRAVA